MDDARYTVFIRPDPDGGFVADVPELPGCISEGETVVETLQSIQEAIIGVLEMRRELGMPARTGATTTEITNGGEP
jgi:predicted RNase H-like HicB family nuclease